MTLRLLAFLALFGLISPALAEEGPAEKTPITQWQNREKEVLNNLKDRTAKETYFVLRNKYGVIRAVRVVKNDIGNAVQACGLENPDIQDQMNTRFKEWKKAVDPILKNADDFLNYEIKHQKTVNQDTFKDVLDLNDKAFEYQQSRIEKRPVTEKKSCMKLLRSMDDTEDKMLALLQDILLPENIIREKAAERPQN